VTGSQLLEILTNFGDSTILLPAAFVFYFVLVFGHEGRIAGAWAAGFSLAVAAVVVGKIVLIPCGFHVPLSPLQSPSGHAALAAAFYPAIAHVAARAAPEKFRRYIVAATFILVLAVAASRLALGAHSVSEVVVGLAFGFFGLFAFRRFCPKLFSVPFGVYPMLVAVVLCVPFLHDQRLSAEPRIAGFSLWLAAKLGFCS
jgi:membrane-associated phospholipid phosphatase